MSKTTDKTAMQASLFSAGAPDNTGVKGAELAEWLGMSQAGITQLKKRGVLQLGVDGRYNLQAAVQSYIASLRKRKSGESRRPLDDQLKYWQVENAKTKNVRWRLDYGRQLILAYRDHHRASLDEFRRALADDARAVEAALRLSDAVRNTDVDEVLYDVAEDDAGEVTDAIDA